MPFELRPLTAAHAGEAVHTIKESYSESPLRAVLLLNGMDSSLGMVTNVIAESAEDPDAHMVRLYDSDAEKMAAFAIWRYTKAMTEKPLHERVEQKLELYFEGNPKILRPYFTEEYKARERVMGESRWWELSALSVHPDYQRKGLGARLMTWGINELEERQLPSVIVSTEAGHGLYVKCGYKEGGLWDIDVGKRRYKNTILTRYPTKMQ